MNYEKILCEFQNFIKAYLSLEHKQHRILDLNLSEVHLLKVAEQNPNYTLIEYAEKLKVSRSAITQDVYKRQELRKGETYEFGCNTWNFTAICRNNSWRSNGILHEKRDE